jgi:hypothetical protein
MTIIALGSALTNVVSNNEIQYSSEDRRFDRERRQALDPGVQRAATQACPCPDKRRDEAVGYIGKCNPPLTDDKEQGYVFGRAADLPDDGQISFGADCAAREAPSGAKSDARKIQFRTRFQRDLGRPVLA